MRFNYQYKLVGFGKYEEIKTEIKEPRPEGYYWVKYHGKWIIAEWFKGTQNTQWYIDGDIGGMSDDSFEKIYEHTLIPPII